MAEEVEMEGDADGGVVEWRLFVRLSKPDAFGNGSKTTQFTHSSDIFHALREARHRMGNLEMGLADDVRIVGMELVPAKLASDLPAFLAAVPTLFPDHAVGD